MTIGILTAILLGACIGWLFGLVTTTFLMTKAVRGSKESNSIFQQIQRENGEHIKRIADAIEIHNERESDNAE